MQKLVKTIFDYLSVVADAGLNWARPATEFINANIPGASAWWTRERYDEAGNIIYDLHVKVRTGHDRAEWTLPPAECVYEAMALIDILMRAKRVPLERLKLNTTTKEAVEYEQERGK